MTGQTNEAQWYIARDGKQHGPLTDVEMRTFVGHNYLRVSDLLWRPGMADWQPAPQLFPQAFQQPQPVPAAPASAPAQQPVQQRPQPASQQQQYTPTAGFPGNAGPAYGRPQGAAGGQQSAPAGPAQVHIQHPGQTQAPAPHADEFTEGQFEDEPRKSRLKQVLVALLIAGLIGGSAYAIVKFKDPIMQLVSGPGKKAPAPATAASEPTAEVPAPAVQPSLADAEAPAAAAAQIEGSAIDTRLQRVPLWSMLKKEYPDWYVTNVAAAEKLTEEKKPQLEVTQQLVQGLVNLRRQNAPNALAASPEKLKGVATAFLENLRALQAQSVGACYGFISKGELSPVVVEIMQAPESATALNTQLAAIFEAASEGAKSPVKHESAGKADYDILIAELSKLGWKDEDLQVFSNPRLLAKREPAQVCKMVQDWFAAHLAVSDAGAQDRLLYETLKPVVSG